MLLKWVMSDAGWVWCNEICYCKLVFVMRTVLYVMYWGVCNEGEKKEKAWSDCIMKNTLNYLFQNVAGSPEYTHQGCS